MGLVRWAAPASEAALPTPAATQAAASQPPLQALRDRLAAAGPWPGGDSPGARQAALPAGTHHGRIFISKRETLSACFERGLFVSNRCAAAGRQHTRCQASQPARVLGSGSAGSADEVRWRQMDAAVHALLTSTRWIATPAG